MLDLVLVFETCRDRIQFFWKFVVLFPVRIKCLGTLQTHNVIILLSLFLGLVNPSQLLIDILGLSIEF